MIKKIIQNWILLFIIWPAAHANNFYIGGGPGYDSTNFHKMLNISHVNGNELYYKDDNLNGDGLFISGYFGYRWIINRIILASELSTKFSSLKYHGYVDDKFNNHEISHGDFTINKSFGLNLLPGYLITDKLILYGRIGVEKGNFKYSEHKKNPNGTNGKTESKWLTGIRYGIGMEAQLLKNFQLRLEYSRLVYQTYFDNSYPLAPNVVRTIKLTPKTNQMELTLLYRF